MDYEKAYKEALNWMRSIYPTLTGSDKEDAEHYFPELAESEDERIRKELVALFIEVRNREGNEGYWHDLKVADILAYLEKQKEQKHDAIDAKSERVIKAARRVLNNWLDGTDCPDVSGDFAELEYAIRKYDGEEKQKEQEHICDSAQYEEGFKTGLEIGLRKQKENPKSTDFIPSDCVSDAKCEDRWHKVEDSLPDNGREVLAKDKLGNTLLARYDGEGWDVSVYDDEDYRCHNGVSKWCEIPFEKPKEQEPNIELIQKSWYMEGYHDCEFGYEPKWVINTGEGGPRYEENPKYEQRIEKQDYSGLNDFERAIHRGFLCAGVENVPVNIIKETAQDCLAHLPAEWSEDFDKEVENIHKRYPEVSFAKLTRIAYHFSKWANSYKGMEWSEEDEKMRNALWNLLKIQYAQDYSMTGVGIEAGKFRDWLKSLRPVSKESLQSWKPSEEQMNVLLNTEGMVRASGYPENAKVLASLYEQLKKLFEI